MTAADQIVQNIKKVLAIGAVHIWQIDLSAEQIDSLRAHVQRMRRSKKEAS
jgi:hypothetical protein